MNLFKLIGDIFNVSFKAREIRQDEEQRQTSVRFAITSIVFSLVAFAFAFGGILLIGIDPFSMGVLGIFLIVIIAALLIGAVVNFIGALVRVIAQLTINRKALGWIALLIFIAAVIASGLVAVFYL